MESLMYLNALKLVPGIGPAKLARLWQWRPQPYAIWRAGKEELISCLGNDQAVDALIEWRGRIQPEVEWEKLQRAGIRVTTPGSPDYPPNLNNIYNPPLMLYYLGDLEQADLSLAIVGSRTASPYGKAMAQSLARNLAEGGFSIVSGLARGIDGAAHRGALLGGGKTITVLGSGLDVIYPREHKALFEEIQQNGAVVSEFPLGTQPLSMNFPVRNRIIAGISLGTLVVEGKEKSGSLITADYALEQGRDVFAMPGPVNSENSRGPHKLIKQGAKLVESAADVLEEYVHLLPEKPAMTAITTSCPQEYHGLMQVLSLQPTHIDDICRQLGTVPEKIAALLVHLELAGQIKQLNGGYYVINFT